MSMLLTVYAESFPKSFHDHVERLRTDTPYRRAFQREVQNMPLDQWYRSPKWKLTTKLRRLLNPTCQDCGATHSLETHHNTYENLGIEVLFLGDLDVLCPDCHDMRHQPQQLLFPPRSVPVIARSC